MITRHTALAAGTIDQGEDIDQYQIGESFAFQHDLCNGLPDIYKKCDVFVLDPPWRRGFDLFNARAKNPTAFTYLEFMVKLSSVIVSLNRPTYVVTGKDELTRLPAPKYTQTIRRDGGAYILAVYHTSNPIEAKNPEELLSKLAGLYNCAGDFVAGYGATAVAFHQANKNFIVSDSVNSCIGVIKKRILQVGQK